MMALELLFFYQKLKFLIVYLCKAVSFDRDRFVEAEVDQTNDNSLSVIVFVSYGWAQ